MDIAYYITFSHLDTMTFALGKMTLRKMTLGIPTLRNMKLGITKLRKITKRLCITVVSLTSPSIMSLIMTL